MNPYARVGLSHLWLVDPLARVLKIYRMEAKHWIITETN